MARTHTQTLPALLTRDTSATHAHVPDTRRVQTINTEAPPTSLGQHRTKKRARSTLEPRTTHTTSVHSRAHKKGHTHPETQSTHTQVQMHTQKPGEPDTHTSVPHARVYKPPHHSLLHSPSHHTRTRTHAQAHTHRHAHTGAQAHQCQERALSASGRSPEHSIPTPAPSSPVSPANGLRERQGRLGPGRTCSGDELVTPGPAAWLRSPAPGAVQHPSEQPWRGGGGGFPAAPRPEAFTGHLGPWSLSPGACQAGGRRRDEQAVQRQTSLAKQTAARAREEPAPWGPGGLLSGSRSLQKLPGQSTLV